MKYNRLKLKVMAAGAILFGAIGTVFTTTFVLPIPAAQACRDCPFPMKVGADRWLMPNGQVEVQLEEVILPGRLVQLDVTLRRADTGEVLAAGTIKHRKGRKNIMVSMKDQEGSAVMAQIHWIDNERERVQIGLSCGGQCAISSLIE